MSGGISAFVLLIAYLLGLGIGIALVGFLIKPLRIPTPKTVIDKDWFDSFAEKLFAACGHLFLKGWQFAESTLKSEGKTQPQLTHETRSNATPQSIPARPFLPTFSLAEMIVMILSIAASPFALDILYMQSLGIQSIVIGVCTFPIAHLLLIEFLNRNAVPLGTFRLILLFIYPYFLYATLFACARSTVWLAAKGLNLTIDIEKLMPHLPARVAGALIVTALGGILIRMYRRSSPPANKDALDWVRVYDFQSKTMHQMPARELAPGMVRTNIIGVCDDCWVDPNQLTRGEYRHPPFTDEQRKVMAKLHEILHEVYPISIEEWEDGFRRDNNMDREIAIMLKLAATYRRLTSQRSYTLEEKEEVYGILLACTYSQKDQVLLVSKFEHIGREHAEHVRDAFDATTKEEIVGLV